MTTENISFECDEVTISTKRSSSVVYVNCSCADIGDMLNSVGIKTFIENSDVDDVLDCLSHGDIVTYMSNSGYEIKEKE